jgi:acyl-CoA synthetase (AMP-forming)/AMP-acid ligase II
MTHPSLHARTTPNKIAYQMAGSGETITYGELDRRSNQGAQLLRALGLKAGDHIAFLMENSLAFMEICWAAQRAALTAIDTNKATFGRSRPMCVYPGWPIYKGAGSLDAAESYACVTE